MRSPDSLVGRVLKGIYFKHGSILEAGLGCNPSYIWRSLIWSKKILVSGLARRVGDGRSIKFFEENWVPSMQSKVGHPLIPWNRWKTLSELIKDGAWDEDLICANFNPYVAGEILRTPLIIATQDSYVRKYDSKGRYSVKDGCRLQCGLLSTAEHQSKHPNENWWSFLWRVSIPPKVRLFWWSISHDCIAANQNLARHHVPVSEACVLCNFPFDSTGHSLFFGSYIKHLWKNSKFSFLLRDVRACPMDLVLWMKEQLHKVDFESFAMHSWAIWRTRQNYIHSDQRDPMTKDIGWSASDFRKARKSDLLPTVFEREQPEMIWQPPRSSSIKLNIDAKVNEDMHLYSIGGIVRDKQGRLLFL